MNPNLHGQLIYHKKNKNIQWVKKTASSINGAGKTRATWRRIKLDYSLISCTKINSKLIKDLNEDLKP